MNSWKDMDFGANPVTEISHTSFTLKDGTRLGMKAWLPCPVEGISLQFPTLMDENAGKWINKIYNGTTVPNDSMKYPCILEYLPYSKDSLLTLSRDHQRHPWMCSHGYVVLRVDLRGTGSSDGFYFGEYEEQEFLDCEELINWISKQEWSNERVGMYGKSWGGFNGLQLAYKQPEALKTIISLYSTDNRYKDDCHYQGNGVVGNGMLSWASFMFAINARPPHPRYFESIEAWKSFWLTRLENSSKSCLSAWLDHQHPNDPFWKHGSVCQDYSKIKCPALIIGGQSDAYKNAATRMAGKLNKDSRVIIGPWTHNWPDVSVCGPNIDFLKLCLEWWDQHLKDTPSNNKTDMPRLAMYLRDSFKAEAVYGDAPGKWVKFPNWEILYSSYEESSPVYCPNSHLKYVYFGPFMSLQFQKSEFGEDTVELNPHALQGSDSGEWFTTDYGLSTDQSIPNKHSSCWRSAKLETDFIFAGLSKLFVSLSAKTPGNYSIQVRVCDEFPTGESTLITKGCLNLSTSSDGWVGDYSGEENMFCVHLNFAGHILKSGHQLLISVTPTYFPSLYPALDNKGLSVHPEKCVFILQSTAGEEFQSYLPFEKPKELLELPCNEISKEELHMSTSSIGDGKFKSTTKATTGMQAFPTQNYECEMKSKENYITDEFVTYGDITGTQCIVSNFTLGEQKFSTVIETKQEMFGDKQRFQTKEHMKVSINDNVFFEKSWNDNIVRKYV